jgi:hypothetical protein
MRDYTTSLTQIKVKKHERLYNITHTNLYFDLCEWCCIVSHVSLFWFVWVMLYSLSCFFTLSLTHIKVKEHERLYTITHTNQRKETWETIQHHDLCEWCCIVSHVSLFWFVWVMLYSLSCFFTLICVSDVV